MINVEQQLNNILKHEEILLRQRARSHYLKGDLKIIYFHMIANGRLKSDHIVNEGGELFTR